MVVGVSGGIAAYKACELVRWLKTRGAAVVVVMTRAAAEFVTPLTFQTLSGNPVVKDLWGDQAPRLSLPERSARKVGGKVEHVDVAEAADVVVLAPATADLMARIVHGEAPDALTAVVMASAAPLVVCPAMDLQMWQQPAVQANARALRARGAILVGPESGALASGLEGVGRLAGVEAIGEAVEGALTRRASLEGVPVLVSAGRTEEAWDPVRVITNRSSGRMGVALAEAARDRGALVTLVVGATSVDPPTGVALVRVGSADEMKQALEAAAPKARIILMAAAVTDFRPTVAAREKIKRSGKKLTLELTANPDILAGLAGQRRAGQVLVGFALETSDGLRRARGKLAAKGVDLIVLNHPSESIGAETNRVTLVEARSARRLPVLAKREVAEAILDRAIELGSVGQQAKAPVRRGAAARGAEVASGQRALGPAGANGAARPRSPRGRRRRPATGARA